MRAVRPALIVVHRWVGLLMTVFLVVAGLTGSVLAFFADLDAALNPELFRVSPPQPGAAVLDPLELHAKVQSQLPAGVSAGVAVLDLEPGRTATLWIDERETFVDPYTARIVGSRKFGEWREGKKNLLTFVYLFHYSLALGDVGSYLFGAVAVLWTLDCFVGAYLTFPAPVTRAPRGSKRRWWARWLPAWQLKTNTLFTAIFTWHRASGLWLWGVLLVFAWSGVALNLGDVVYDPVMNTLLPAAEEPDLADLDPPRTTPRISLQAARERGRQLMAASAFQRGFRVIQERWLEYGPKHGAYTYVVESTLDTDARLAQTTIVFDGDDGRELGFRAPTGQSLRRSFDTWLISLHFGAIRELGVVYRIIVMLFGIGVALLTVSGVWIWWRKRSKSDRREKAR